MSLMLYGCLGKVTKKIPMVLVVEHPWCQHCIVLGVPGESTNLSMWSLRECQRGRRAVCEGVQAMRSVDSKKNYYDFFKHKFSK